MNIFEYPRKYRKLILKHTHVHQNLRFDGRCHVGCSHCMFSANMDEEKNAFNTMTKERVDRLMDLVTDSNTGYLLISGGGEIFLEPELIYQIVEKTSADITWLATRCV